MKVSDVMSSATVGSSRALSIVAAVIGIVVLSRTPPVKIPMISFIDIDTIWHYSIALVLLLYMTAAHYMNWRQDVLTYKEGLYARWVARREAIDAVGDRVQIQAPASVELSDDFKAQLRDDYKETVREESERIWVALGTSIKVTVYGMHFGVPFGLSFAAITSLTIRLIECVNGRCC